MKSIEVKTPETKHKIHPLITKRWSARAFSNKQITKEDLFTLFEAAAWSASSMNEQPWLYQYAFKTDQGNFNKYWECLLSGNQPWAKDGSVILLSLARKNFIYKNGFNRHHMHDVGAANTQLLLQAASMDIYGHMMGGFDMQKTIETFNIPDDLEPVCFIVLGYLNDAETLEEPFKTRELTPRSRKAVDEFVKEGL